MQKITSPSNKHSSLEQLEQAIRSKIYAAATPYIGLIPELLSPDDHDFIATSLSFAGGKLANLERGLKRFPASFLSYLVVSLKQDLGSESNSVYETLNQILSQHPQTPITNNEKTSLWRAFRYACQKLELPISNRRFGPNYMVDAYFEQTGIAEANLGRVWEKMAMFARKQGLPDVYDLSAQNIWYSQFCATLNAPFSRRSRRALENDATGYYLQQFCSLLANDPEFQQESFQDAVLPYLLFNGDGLALSFPASTTNQLWTLTLDGDHQRVETGTEPSTIYLNDLEVRECNARSSSGTEFNFALWKDERNNQFAFFEADAHRFISSHSLTDDGVVLNPGRYRILSRFPINLDWLHTVECLEEGFYWGEFHLEANKKAIIQRGPASFVVRTHSHAIIELEGSIITPHAGAAFYSSHTLNIKAKLPEEWELGSGDYELIFSAPHSGREHCIPVTFQNQHQFTTSLTNVSDDWGNTFERLNISLRRSGQSRPLARTSCVVWFGLQELAGGFKPVCATLPENISSEHCENVCLAPGNRSMDIKDPNLPFLTLGFQIRQRILSLKLALPGTYIYLDHSENEVRRETLIPAGTTLSASYHDRRLIRIYSTERGVLKLGEKVLHDNFEKRPWSKLSIASLFDHLEGQANTLTFVADNYSKPLIKLVSPHNISDWQAALAAESVGLSFITHAPLDAISFTAQELITDRLVTHNFHKDKLFSKVGSSPINGMLISQDIAPYRQKLPLNISHMPDGLWFVQFSAQIKERWGVISNERQDQYALLLNIESGEVLPYSTTQLEQVDQLPLHDKNRLLETVNTLLRTCFERSCWETLRPLKALWLKLIYSQEVISADNLKNLLPYTQVLPDENASPSWVPLLHIGAYNPLIYAANADCYQSIDTNNNINLRCFRAIHECGKNLGEAIRQHILAGVVALAFQNKNDVIQADAPPRNLSPERLNSALLATCQPSTWEKLLRLQSEPTLGELLGSYHLAYCQRETLSHLRRTDRGNEYLRPAMLRLANRYRNASIQIMPNLVPLAYFEYEREMVVLEEISRLASALAKACREQARGKNSIELLLNQLRQELLGDSQDVRSVLSFFLSLAGELFHYYLLFWEVYYTSRDE